MVGRMEEEREWGGGLLARRTLKNIYIYMYGDHPWWTWLFMMIYSGFLSKDPAMSWILWKGLLKTRFSGHGQDSESWSEGHGVFLGFSWWRISECLRVSNGDVGRPWWRNKNNMDRNPDVGVVFCARAMHHVTSGARESQQSPKNPKQPSISSKTPKPRNRKPPVHRLLNVPASALTDIGVFGSFWSFGRLETDLFGVLGGSVSLFGEFWGLCGFWGEHLWPFLGFLWGDVWNIGLFGGFGGLGRKVLECGSIFGWWVGQWMGVTQVPY